jgi:hypothetical protein
VAGLVHVGLGEKSRRPHADLLSFQARHSRGITEDRARIFGGGGATGKPGSHPTDALFIESEVTNSINSHKADK